MWVCGEPRHWWRTSWAGAGPAEPLLPLPYSSCFWGARCREPHREAPGTHGPRCHTWAQPVLKLLLQPSNKSAFLSSNNTSPLPRQPCVCPLQTCVSPSFRTRPTGKWQNCCLSSSTSRSLPNPLSSPCRSVEASLNNGVFFNWRTIAYQCCIWFLDKVLIISILPNSMDVLLMFSYWQLLCVAFDSINHLLICSVSVHEDSTIQQSLF